MYRSFLEQTFLFKNVDGKILDEIFLEMAPYTAKYKKNETISSLNVSERKIGFVFSGRAVVKKTHSQGEDVRLNVLNIGDSFGVLPVLSGEYPTQILALSDCEILYIGQEDFLLLIKKHIEIANNVISFLVNRIVFLNNKISTFSAYNVEQKLANYLYELHKKSGDYSLSFSKTSCAMALNAGRASLYRAIDSLQNEGIIKVENKKIIINDLKSLERKTK